MTLIFPRDVAQIIFEYMKDLEKFDKVENIYFQFLKQFRYIYKPIVDGVFDSPLSHSPAYYPLWPNAHIRFIRSEQLFNRFAWRLDTLRESKDYWIRRALDEIHWGGVIIVYWSQGSIKYYQFLKTHLREQIYKTVMENGYIFVTI
jgi:hypothetical protein